MYSSSGDIEIGATLRKARLDSGVTLEDVEYETKIRKRYLEALEREDYGDLPSAVYARGFLKTYANYLGLDGEELSRELQARWDAVRERQRREAAPKEGHRGRRYRARAFTGGMASRHRVSPLAILGFVLAFALLAAAVGGLYWVGQSSRLTEDPPESRPAEPSGGSGGQPSDSGGTPGDGLPAAQEAPAPSADGGAEAGRPGSAEEPPPEVVRITVTVEQVPAWLNVQTYGELVYEQIAQPGFSQTFEAGQQIAVWTGNAGAVRLEVNGQDFGTLGAPGEVTRRVFALKPAEG